MCIIIIPYCLESYDKNKSLYVFTTNLKCFPKTEASNNSNLLSPVISYLLIGEWPGWTVPAQSSSQGLRPVAYKTVSLWGLSWVGGWTFKWVGSWLQIQAGSWREAWVTLHTDFSLWLPACPCSKADQSPKPQSLDHSPSWNLSRKGQHYGHY